MADKENPSYLDENLTEQEKKSGRLRQPNQVDEKPYPGEENRADKNYERPDEFGDGDRRS
jgi:hypothetical protein